MGRIPLLIAGALSGCVGRTPTTTLHVPPPSVAAADVDPRLIHPGVLRGLLTDGELAVAMNDPALTREALGGDATVSSLVRVCLDADGNATAELVREGKAAFDAAALAVVNRWRFRPYQRGGKTRAACSVAELTHDFTKSEQRPALPEARVELPDAIEAPVAIRGRATSRPPTPGVAFARICRASGTRTAPRFSLLQSSGDPTFDRAIFDEPVTAPVREPRGSKDECWLRAGVSGKRQSFEFEIRDPDAKEVSEKELEVVQLSGDKAIFPADETKYEILEAGSREINVPVRLCIDTTGKPVQVRVLQSSGFFFYDMELINGVAAWRFKPVPTPLCSRIQFTYRQR